MVPVAQRLERRTVDAEAEGSKPFRHPIPEKCLLRYFFYLRRQEFSATNEGIKSFVCKQENINDSQMMNEKK